MTRVLREDGLVCGMFERAEYLAVMLTRRTVDSI